MNIMGTIFGGAAAKPIEAIGGVLDSLFTSDEERLDKKALLEKLAQRPMEAQNAINLAQAQHRSVFVAGPRPFIMWVCGFAMAWHFMVYEWVAWYMIVNHPSVSPFPKGDTAELISVVIALLGLGSLRTVEKAKGLTR